MVGTLSKKEFAIKLINSLDINAVKVFLSMLSQQQDSSELAAELFEECGLHNEGGNEC